jgi:hypothetical protein
MAPETPLQEIMLDGDSSLLCSQIISFNSLMPGQLARGALSGDAWILSWGGVPRGSAS